MRKLIILFLLAGLNVNAQNIYTIAGNGNSGYNGDSLFATKTSLNIPSGSVAVDASGNVYIADYGNHLIRKLDANTGKIFIIAGTGDAGYNGDGIAAINAELYYPTSVAVDNAGNLYITDYANNRIRKITASTGLISTIAGTGAYGYNGDSIPATSAKISETTAICLDNSNNVYFTDLSNSRIRKIDVSTGLIYTVAGNGSQGYNGDNISAKSASLNFPYGLCIDAVGNLYIGDRENHRVRKVNSNNGIITTIAGNGSIGFNGDTIPATSAIVYNPHAVAIDNAGNLFIADSWTNRIRKVTVAGTIFTVAGNGTGSFSGDGGLATSATLNSARGIAVDQCNNLYISDYYNQRIRKVESFIFDISTTSATCFGTCDGNVSAIASGGSSPYNYSFPGLTVPPAQNNFCQGDYFMKVTDANGCSEMRTVSVSQPDAMITTVTSTNASCNSDGSASLTVNGGTSPYTYSWSSGSTLPTATGLSAGTYSVIITDNEGCTTSRTAVINNENITYASTPICMVTVDSLSQNNIIIWDKSNFAHIDTFIVFREIGTNDYRRIAAILNTELSQFIDTVRTEYFPNTGNPNGGTYRYKIQVVDSCGRTSMLSPYHNTIFIINNNGTFSWPQPYTIESSANPVNSYVLMRDDYSNGNWHAVNSVAGTQQTITDPAYGAFSSTASWRVETFWNISCTPSRSYSASLSNKFTNVITNVNLNEALVNRTKLYPTVSQGIFTVETSELKEATIQIYSFSGKKVYEESIITDKQTIDMTRMAKGVYFARITSGNSVFNKRLIIQ